MRENRMEFRDALKELQKRGITVTICEAGQYTLRQQGSGQIVKDSLPKEQVSRFSILAKLDKWNPVLR